MSKILLEALPLATFFLLYKTFSLKAAIIGILISTTGTLVISRLLKFKMDYIFLFAYLVLLITGSLSLYSDDAIFFKIKSTIINFSLASILIFDYLRKQKYKLLHRIIPSIKDYSAESLDSILKLWIAYFLVAGILNEIVWRNFSEDLWVNYKIFGSITLSVVTSAITLILLRRNPGS